MLLERFRWHSITEQSKSLGVGSDICGLDFHVVLDRPGFSIMDRKRRTGCMEATGSVDKEEARCCMLGSFFLANKFYPKGQ